MNSFDDAPVVRLHLQEQFQWLLTEIDPDAPDRAFGLCDLNMGSPELGSVSLTELYATAKERGLRLAADPQFVAQGPISAYASAARAEQRIVPITPAAASVAASGISPAADAPRL